MGFVAKSKSLSIVASYDTPGETRNVHGLTAIHVAYRLPKTLRIPKKSPLREIVQGRRF